MYYEQVCAYASNGCNYSPTVGTVLQVTAGQDIFLSVSSGGAAPGPGLMNITCLLVTYNLPNDLCSGAIAAASEQTFYDTTLATNDQVVPIPSIFRDVWFTWVATCTGSMKIKGTSQSAQQVLPACDSTSPILSSTYGSLGTGPVVTGTTYYIKAGLPSYPTSVKAHHFNFSCSGAPPNDAISTALPWTAGLDTWFNYSNDGASTTFCQSDIFYNWTATCTGMARLTTCGSGQFSTAPTYQIMATSG